MSPRSYPSVASLRRRAGPGLLLVLLAALPACRTPLTPAASPRAHPESACLSAPDADLMDGDGVFAVPGQDDAHHKLRFVDGQVSRNDSCMIRLGNRLNRRVPPLYVNGEPVGFCWVPCPDVFVQDVPEALNRKGLTYACYMDPTRDAIVDETHAVRVNYETYLFGDTAARELFLGDVVRFCGLVTDPVSKRRFRPHEGSPTAEDPETRILYFFESEEGRDMFVMDPEGYRLPGYTM